jgi:hypothetical protein
MSIVRYHTLYRGDFSDYGNSDREAQMSTSQGIVASVTSFSFFRHHTFTVIVLSFICSSTLLPGVLVDHSTVLLRKKCLQNNGLEC